jgi:hypothetical protein
MNEVNEWEVLAEEGIADEGNVDRPVVCPSFETIHIVYQKTTAKGLSRIATKVGVSPNGTNRKLFDRIRDSGNVVKVDEDSFDYRRQIVTGRRSQRGSFSPLNLRWRSLESIWQQVLLLDFMVQKQGKCCRGRAQ